MRLKGFGPMAEMLAIETLDLTELSKRNGGKFPTEAVARQFDGQSPVLAHDGEMPNFELSLQSVQNVTGPLADQLSSFLSMQPSACSG